MDLSDEYLFIDHFEFMGKYDSGASPGCKFVVHYLDLSDECQSIDFFELGQATQWGVSSREYTTSDDRDLSLPRLWLRKLRQVAVVPLGRRMEGPSGEAS